MEIILPAEIAKYAIDINTATKENIEEAIKKYAQDHNGENKVIFRGNWGENAFIGIVIKTIYVPKGSKSQYEQLKGNYGIEQSVNIVEL